MATDEAEDDAVDEQSNIIRSLGDALDAVDDAARVERVYGRPVETERRTVVPVARVVYGFGSGFGDDDETGAGAGAGGGVVATPVGALEITDETTRFIRFSDWRGYAVAACLGIVLGRLLGRR
jgi:uncharacterized spore protein YtfJ